MSVDVDGEIRNGRLLAENNKRCFELGRFVAMNTVGGDYWHQPHNEHDRAIDIAILGSIGADAYRSCMQRNEPNRDTKSHRR